MTDLKHNNPIVRTALISAGLLCVGLGVIGLFVPMMPGAVFLIIAAWCFARSSDRFHQALLNHRYVGPQIHAWQSGRGFQRALRRRILLIMWSSMFVSMLLIGKLIVAFIIGLCGIGVTLFIIKQPVYD